MELTAAEHWLTSEVGIKLIRAAQWKGHRYRRPAAGFVIYA
jgi:hypothetical protein